MKYLKELQDILSNSKTPKQVIQALKKTKGISYYLDNNSSYFNLKIYSDNVKRDEGYLRVYQDNHKNIKVQLWTRCEMKYSGIPTFCPSGRNSLV